MINNKLILVKRSNFTLFFFKAACYDNPGAERNFAGSGLDILRGIFQICVLNKFSNTSANNNVSL